MQNTGAIVIGLLGILFVALKLTNHIDWSWWWVTAPFWGGAALALGVLVFAITWMVIASTLKRHKRRKT